MWFYKSPRVISLWKVHNLKVLKFGKVKILIIILLLFKKNTFILSFFKPKVLSFFYIERCFHEVIKKIDSIKFTFIFYLFNLKLYYF